MTETEGERNHLAPRNKSSQISGLCDCALQIMRERGAGVQAGGESVNELNTPRVTGGQVRADRSAGTNGEIRVYRTTRCRSRGKNRRRAEVFQRWDHTDQLHIPHTVN